MVKLDQKQLKAIEKVAKLLAKQSRFMPRYQKPLKEMNGIEWTQYWLDLDWEKDKLQEIVFHEN